MPRKTKEPLIEKQKNIKLSSEGKISMQKTITKKDTVSEKKSSPSKKTTIDNSSSKVKVAKDKNVHSNNKKTTTKKKSSISKKSSVKINMEHLTEYYDLPYKYNKTVVKILAQTPKTLFVYWEISDEDRLNYIKNYGENFFDKTKPVLIIHNKTKKHSFEIEINDFANSWYFNVEDESCEYSVELGRRPLSEGKINIDNNYLYVASSNEIESPNGHILFDESSKTIYFRNVKTNQSYSKHVANLQFIKRISKIYNLSDFYKVIYKNENIFDINNPTSK